MVLISASWVDQLPQPASPASFYGTQRPSLCTCSQHQPLEVSPPPVSQLLWTTLAHALWQGFLTLGRFLPLKGGKFFVFLFFVLFFFFFFLLLSGCATSELLKVLFIALSN